MSSVLALRLKGWIVFFIGTADGQLIKLAVDKNYRPTCPKVLYETSGDNRVFPNIRLDPVDQKHVYVPFKNQVQRVPVANCRAYQNMKDCLSAQDPHCVWCVTQASCTFKDDCKDAEWLSIPGHSNQKIISHRFMEDSPGNLKIVIQTHLTIEDKVRSNFACQFSTSSTPPCKEQGPQPQYPQCTCILKDPFPADGIDITIKITLGKTFLKEQIKMINCPDFHGQPSVHLCQQCIRAGCGWRENSCSWATDPVQNDSICANIELFGIHFSKPEISSIDPSVVSFYGRNNAVLKGHNLRDVTKVRIQSEMNCDPKESPVWNNNGSSLMFHIPSSETIGVVTVCLLLSDGSCHGNTKVTYQSSPICTGIVPGSSWKSGKRMVTLTGTHMNLVEKVTHSHAPHVVILPRKSSNKALIYETPAVKNDRISSSTVFLKIANQTLACSTKITYYPDPEFTSFTAVSAEQKMQISIQKKADKLKMTPEELLVWGIQNGKQHPCIMKSKESRKDIEIFSCEVQSLQNADIAQIKISYGEATINLRILSTLHKFLLILRLLLIPCVIAALVAICLWKKVTCR
ncbi:plexin-C1-like [Fundulus heteroclitus]|uniref:plexin-C1-like n=1 Tax=Fundulus heteroclitus TaxID=8078 RepID=UPI00165B7E40|nr:plexin-C1-like [Fundulus heteroclitus]